MAGSSFSRVGLIFFLFLALMELGGFIAEMRRRKAIQQLNLMEIFCDVEKGAAWQIDNFNQVLDASALSPRQKNQLLDEEEFRCKEIIDKMDLLAKLGPVLGLMGTLISNGPGLGIK